MRRWFIQGFVGCALSGTSILGIAAPPAAAAAVRPAAVRFDIPAMDLAGALEAFGKQSGKEIIFDRAQAAGKRSAPVLGVYEPRKALSLLLAGSGLSMRMANEGTFVVEPVGNGVAAGEAAALDNEVLGGTTEQGDGADDRAIVVTGTHIRGARSSSPVVTISREEMRRSGQNNLGEAIRALPQNFAGGQNPGVATGATAGGASNQNVTGSSSLNLRGLGPDASLTLLNGSRLPYDGFIQGADLSVIPTAAIDRVEILLDGASAIYGSDAVGGVANVILRRDYRGLELSARHGLATDGGYEQQQYTALAGDNWLSGGFLITGDFSFNTAVKASQRDYLSAVSSSSAYDIYPRNKQYSTLFSGHQDIGPAEIALDGFYTRRTNSFLIPGSDSRPIATFFESKTSIWGLAPSVKFEIDRNWNVRLNGSISRDVSATPGRKTFNYLTGDTLSVINLRNRNHSEAVGVEADGRLFALPAGDVGLSFGGGWRRNFFEGRDLTTGASTATPNGGGSDRSFYEYGEINIPVVSPEQRVPFMDRFAINAAVRHENYDSFGNTTTPKLGMIWSVSPGFKVRATWGRSFKVPTLQQQYLRKILYLASAASLGGNQVGAPPDAQAILLFGGNRDLKPEQAKTISAGFAVDPAFVPKFHFEMNWYQIDYKDRIIYPITIFEQSLSNPDYAQFVTTSPTAGEISSAFAWAGLPEGMFTFDLLGQPYDPSRVYAVVSDQNTNAASDLLRGLDVSTRYAMDALDGRLALNANGSWITKASRRVSSTSPEIAIAGRIFFPAKFRGRLGLSWSRDGFTFTSNVNHISGVIDTNVTPNVKRSSMTTLDLILDYRMVKSPIGSFGVNLAVINALNQAPPFAQPVGANRVNYDSTNYSALGRTISLTLTKSF
jgi:outer membrane receptor protein involved in Fe transport